MTPAFVVTAIDGSAQAAATLGLQFDLPGVVVVHHRLDIPGQRLYRTVADITGVLEEVEIDVAHACATCALREDMLPTLQRLAEIGRWEAIVARLPLSAEATQLCQLLDREPAAASDVRIAGVVCALDGASLVEDLTGDDALVDQGREAYPDDERGVGETLAGLIEYADVVSAHTPDLNPAAGPGLGLVRALARPGAVVAPVWPGLDADALLDGLRDQAAADAWASEVRRDPLPERLPDGTWRLELCSDRPLHPERLNAQVETLGSHRHRARGCFWLATRPGDVCGWDGAGGHVSIGSVGRWRPGEAPFTRIVVTGLTGEPGAMDRLRSAFERCLLTDAEIAERGPCWEVRRDGLEPWLGSIHQAA